MEIDFNFFDFINSGMKMKIPGALRRVIIHEVAICGGGHPLCQIEVLSDEDDEASTNTIIISVWKNFFDHETFMIEKVDDIDSIKKEVIGLIRKRLVALISSIGSAINESESFFR